MALTSKEMVELLEKNGFVKIRQKGSHAMYKNYVTNKQVTVPMHGKDLQKGLERAIIKQAGIKGDKYE